MRILKLSSLFLLFLAVMASCTTGLDENEPASPEFSDLITGSYTFTTTKAGTTTGSGTAIISKEANNKIRITMQDGVSFYANKLQRLDDDLVMDIPQQTVDYYGMDAQFAGSGDISRAGSRYHGVYFGSQGKLQMSILLTINNKTDNILITLSR